MLTHEPSGFVLSFTAEGALRAWARDSVLSDRELHIRVAPAEKAVWRSRVAAAQERTSQAVDWTFCSGEYGGDDHGTGGGGGGSGGGVGGAGAATALPGLPKPALSAGATARSGAAGGGATSIRGAAASSPSGARGPAVVWREHEGSGLDMDLLRRRSRSRSSRASLAKYSSRERSRWSSSASPSSSVSERRRVELADSESASTLYDVPFKRNVMVPVSLLRTSFWPSFERITSCVLDAASVP
jgi:hypothetical protein